MTKQYHQLTVLVPPAVQPRYGGRHHEHYEGEVEGGEGDPAPSIPPPPAPGCHDDP